LAGDHASPANENKGNSNVVVYNVEYQQIKVDEKGVEEDPNGRYYQTVEVKAGTPFEGHNGGNNEFDAVEHGDAGESNDHYNKGQGFKRSSVDANFWCRRHDGRVRGGGAVRINRDERVRMMTCREKTQCLEQ
jgi:hypothetical protein